MIQRHIIVTGIPASGKTTVGHAVAASLGLPMLDKDEILEIMFNSQGVGNAEWRTRLSRTADEALKERALRSGGAVIASWWRHPKSHVDSGRAWSIGCRSSSGGKHGAQCRFQNPACSNRLSMDYDATDIAAAYDRGRNHGPEFLDLWMDIVSSHVKDQPIKTILDLGCGTGRFSEALAARFDAEVVGVDPSKKMLEQARTKRRDPRVRYELGRGEAIPLPNSSVDLMFMSMIFHHFNNPTLAGRECRRVLRDGGIALLRAGTRERISSYPYVGFFPESRPILEETLASGALMREVFESVGFRTVTVDVVTQEIAPNYGVYAEKLSAGADSVLARLSQSEFEAGIRALRLHAARIDTQAVFEPIDVFVFR